MNALLWSLVAFAAFSGWAVTLFILTRGLVPTANAFNILERLGERQDEQIRKVVERIQNRTGGGVPEPAAKRPQTPAPNVVLDQVNQVFGGTPFEIGDQPDSEEGGMDIVEGA